MSEQNFTVESRPGYGWCVVGSSDNAVYDFSTSETEARLWAVQRTVLWADGVDARLRRRPRHETVAAAVHQAVQAGHHGACAHVIADRLACPAEELVDVLAALEDLDELAEIDECVVCRRPMYGISTRTNCG
jgi:hypothetical protein